VADLDVLVHRLRAAGCVFAEDEAALLAAEARDEAHLEAMAVERVGGRPLEQVVGWARFAGLRIALEPGVFVPRRRTELVAELAVELARAAGPRPVVVELCCGAAPVGAAVLAALPEADLTVADVDAAAVRAARLNVGGRARVLQGDLDAPLPSSLRGTVDVLVANAPYVPTEAVATMPPEARDHEPRVALDGGADGLDVARRMVACAPTWLRPGGHLVVETSLRQAPALVAAYERAGLVAETRHDEERGGTAVVGRFDNGSQLN
jgi:release factor glutamine methyltransferase